MTREQRLAAALERIRTNCSMPWVREVAAAALEDREVKLVAGMAGWKMPRRRADVPQGVLD